MTRPRPNAELFELADRAGTFVLANLFWVLLAIPIITLPMATAGLFATLSPWSRGKPAEVFHDFFHAMRRYWLKATAVALADVFIAAWIILNMMIFRHMDVGPITWFSRIVTLLVALIGIMANFYVWPLMVTVELPLRSLFLNSVKLVFVHPLWSFGLLILLSLLFALSALLPAAVLVLFSFSAAALLINWGAWRVIRRYVPENERNQAEEVHGFYSQEG